MTQPSIKVGMIAEETGALSFMGRANANVARMVVDEINANGGLLGRKIELYLEDGATTDAVAEAKAAKLVAQDKVDVIFGGGSDGPFTIGKRRRPQIWSGRSLGSRAAVPSRLRVHSVVPSTGKNRHPG